MNKSGDLGSPLGQLGSIPNKTVHQLVKEPVEAAEKVEEQAGVKPVVSQKPSGDNKPADTLNNTNISSSKTTLEIVKKMYEASETKINVPSDKIISAVIQENPQRSPEEIQKLATTRQQLLQQQHKTTYYDPTFNPPKKQEEPRPAERAAREEEQEEKKKMEELKVEEKKKEELAPSVKQGTHEKYPGISA